MPRTLDLSPPSSGEPDVETGSIYFVGNATVVLRYAGFTVLTDPNFLHRGEHAHLGYGLTTERQTDPAIGIDEVPPDVDVVLLSHYHGDHFDRVVEERLDVSLPIVTTPGAAEQLAAKGFHETYPLDAWDRIRLDNGTAELTITATPARHGPPVVARALPDVMGSVLEFERDGRHLCRLYVSGDTVVHEALREIPRRYPQIDLALVHLGGTKVLGLLLTMDAEQGVEAVRLIGADTTIPIHYDDYDVFESSLEEFREAVAEAGLEGRVAYVDRGETYEFAVPADRA